ncbi:multiple epidermal growth factor-like domains protein 6 isoform X2 [Ruditapes philippinarum]|uniref:multiple epidermal growth factor-like domains protein 6 isoform X2 n=1 Tax=Ruditapes philippinarum TaxID=129788 RepID=UPI00295A85E3|nr:multiple epidermal growth factor-like domains protein 6 isoform X2 [Ruditapes philippinarum]
MFSLTNCSDCIGKHWGRACQQCPVNCLNCSSNSICSSCDTEFHGKICNKQCNVNCLDGRCDLLSGNCNDGCVNGFYGNPCDMKCGNDCVNLTCDRVRGTCLHGCKAGYNAINSATGNEDTKGVIIGAAVGGCILLIIIVVLVAAVVLLARRLKRLENSRTPLESNKDLGYYNINNAFVGANTDTDTRQADVIQPTTVYESLTTACSNRFADYSSLQLQDVPTSELPNDHTVKLDPGVQYYNVSAK